MDLRSVCFTLLVYVGLCFGQDLVLPDRLNGAVGGSITFTPISAPSPPHRSITWAFETKTIVNAVEGSIFISDDYINRASFDINTLSLEIRSLTERDAGTYSLNVGSAHDETSLQMFVPISNVIIEPSETELVEFNSSVSLTCSASGSSLSYLWLNRSSEVSEGERVVLTDDNRTLTITSMRRDDSGPYTCEVSNIISSASSPPLNLIIYYGPEDVTVKHTPEEPFYSSGSDVTLTCSAESSPAADFHWALNGTELGQTGQDLQLSNIQSSQRGSYTCLAQNHKTQRSIRSEPVSITVLVNISRVTLTGSADVVTEGNPFNLTCEGSGDITKTEWMKDNRPLSAGDGLTFSTDNKRLMINPVKRKHSGEYQCTIRNPVSSGTAKYRISFNGDGGGLSAGAIAGIVIGVLLGLAAVAGLIFYFMKTKQKPKTSTSTDKNSGGTQMQGEPELNYADIQHSQNNWRQYGRSSVNREKTNQWMPNQAAPPTSDVHVIYSEVRK